MERMACDDEAAIRAARVISRGGVVVFPTDTVYGVGCDPYNSGAVKRVYDIKGRDPSKAFPVLARSTDVARSVAKMDSAASLLASRFWPGSLTMILEVTDRGLEKSLGLCGRIAIRVPAGRCVGLILQKCGMVVGTSANTSGRMSPADPADVSLECDLFLDGGVIPGGRESTIVDATKNDVAIIRQGIITREMMSL